MHVQACGESHAWFAINHAAVPDSNFHPPPADLTHVMEHQHGQYLISDDPARLDAIAIHAYLSRSYWSENIPLEVVQRALQGSLCLGAYGPDGAQVGLVRIISDHATFAYLCDVYVLEGHRRHGLAKAMVKFALRHPRLQRLRSWSLRTRDAHGLYAQLGFKPVENPDSYMILKFPDVYRLVAEDE